MLVQNFYIITLILFELSQFEILENFVLKFYIQLKIKYINNNLISPK